jgi:hypothetical protein
MPIIPATREAEIRRILVQGQPMQKLVRPPSQLSNWALWLPPVIPATQEADIGGSQVKASPGQK